MFLERRRNRFRNVLARGLRMQLTVMVPAAVGLLALAHPIVAIFKVGKVTGDDITRLAGILRAFSVGCPASLPAPHERLQGDARHPHHVHRERGRERGPTSSSPRCSCSLGGAWRGSPSPSLAYVIGAALALVVVRQRLHGLNDRVLLLATARIGAASALMGAAVVGTSELVAAILGDQGGRPAALVQVGAAVVVGVTVYAIAGTWSACPRSRPRSKA